MTDAQYNLEYAQKQYQNKAEAFARAEAALAKVLEAVGNGVAANITPSNVTTGANSTTGSYVGSDDKIRIEL